MTAMALSAKYAGAVGIRANGPEDVSAIKKATDLPMIGINKVYYNPKTRKISHYCTLENPSMADYDKNMKQELTYITPTLEDAKSIVEAGADIVALTITLYPRPKKLNKDSYPRLIKKIKDLGVLVMADISCLQEAEIAVEAGADLIATTRAGRTPYTPFQKWPDYGLIKILHKKFQVPIVAEGRISTPEQAKFALMAGATFIVVGTVITNPFSIAKEFVNAVNEVEILEDRRKELLAKREKYSLFK